MTKSNKTKSPRKGVKLRSLPKTESKLSGKEMKRVKGGLLPYIEQDNVRGSTNIQDGTSNTILRK